LKKENRKKNLKEFNQKTKTMGKDYILGRKRRNKEKDFLLGKTLRLGKRKTELFINQNNRGKL